MIKDDDGVWSVTTGPLEPSLHFYPGTRNSGRIVAMGPGPAVASQANDEQTLRGLFREYADKWNARDLEGVSSWLADEVVQMPGNEPVIVGKQALMADWRAYLENYSDQWEPTLTDMKIAGDVAFLHGSFVETRTPRAGGATQTQKANGPWVARRDGDGDWKLVLESWFGSGWE